MNTARIALIRFHDSLKHSHPQDTGTKHNEYLSIAVILVYRASTVRSG